MKNTKSIFVTIAMLAGGFAAQGATLVNLDATNANGSQTVNLGAGTYSISVIGTSVSGALYNGWNIATQNYGTPSAIPSPNQWTERFSVTAGGVTTSYNLPGNAMFSSASTALAAYQSSVLYVDGTNTPADPSLKLDSALLTLSNQQNVLFSIPDTLFADNWGGVSLSITQATAATPEPSTFGLIGLAAAGGVAAWRKRKA